jgi:hypothetical protein
VDMASKADADGNSEPPLGSTLQRRESSNSIGSFTSIASIFSIRSFFSSFRSSGNQKQCGKVVVYEPLDKKLSLEDVDTVNSTYLC